MSNTEIRQVSQPFTTQQASVSNSSLPVELDSSAQTDAFLVETVGANVLAPVMDIDRLYEGSTSTNSQMVSALELLKTAADLLNEGRLSGNPMEGDRALQRVQLLLPKLFELRGIGEGFGLLITTLHFAFVNMHGVPPTQNQLNAVWRTIRELRNRPMMTMDQIVDRVEELETAGFQVDPSDLETLAGAEDPIDED